jgi:CRISPR-associated endonuclease/helicase Cas3
LALGAHHGRYVPQAGAELIRYFREEVRAYPEIGALREALLDELSNCFGPLSTEPVGRHSAALHWLTGLVTFADWVGSNTDWFPLLGPGELRDVWTPDEARHAAEKAVGELGWHRSAVTAQLGFGDLFAPLSNGESLSPRPLQSVLIAAADRPGLIWSGWALTGDGVNDWNTDGHRFASLSQMETDSGGGRPLKTATRDRRGPCGASGRFADIYPVRVGR